MNIQLDEGMWRKILAQSGGDLPPAFKSPKPGGNTVYLLALEGSDPDPKWTFWEKALDTAVQMFQPSPAMTHVELFIPPDGEADEAHYATYLGKKSGFGSSFGGVESSRKFYLEQNGEAWRAIPIMAPGATVKLRDECTRQQNVPYGSAYRLFNYPYAVPPFRSLAWTVDMSPEAPAHCASLTARCIQAALPELQLPHTPAWYGPSTLFLELSREARMTSYKHHAVDMAHLRALVEDEEAVDAEDRLLRGSDARVKELTEQQCLAGIEHLTKRVTAAGSVGDETAARVSQRELARALLRFSLVNRGGPPDVPDDELVAKAEAAHAEAGHVDHSSAFR